MSLNGSLTDIGIIDLLQFPHQGRKTGLLTLDLGDKKVARLYYKDGNLVHAASGSIEGDEVLISLVDLVEGSFVFEADVASPKSTIKKDLHHALLHVLKLRDERKNTPAPIPQPKDDGMQWILTCFQSAFQRCKWMKHVALLGPNAQLVVERSAPDQEPMNTEPLRNALIKFLRSYPGGTISKLIIEQGSALSMAVSLADKSIVLVVCGEGAIMGPVVATVTKLAQAIDNKTEMKKTSETTALDQASGG